MDFTHAIPIFIFGPHALSGFMADGFVDPTCLRQVVVSLPLIGIDNRIGTGFGFYIRL